MIDWPHWFTPSKNIPVSHCRRVALGRHPLGGTLGPIEKHCGDCAHVLRQSAGSRTFLKCAVHVLTNRPGSDLRLKWRSCDAFKDKADA